MPLINGQFKEAEGGLEAMLVRGDAFDLLDKMSRDHRMKYILPAGAGSGYTLAASSTLSALCA